MKKQTYLRSVVPLLLCLCFVLSGCASDNTPSVPADVVSPTTEPAVAVTPDESALPAEEESPTAEPSDDIAMETATAGTYPDGSSPTLSGVKLKLTVNGAEEVIIAMYDNTAADAFVERLPLTDLAFFDLSGIEKPIAAPDEPFSLGEESPGYDPIAGEMVIYRPWGNFTIFYGDFRHSDELVPLGIVERGLDVIAAQTEDFTGVMELMESVE